jgi:hypothetical protein
MVETCQRAPVALPVSYEVNGQAVTRVVEWG